MITDNDVDDFAQAVGKILHFGGTIGLADCLYRVNSRYDHDILIDLEREGFIILTRELHITEQKYPLQTQRFREILDEMYQTHLIKNADYSPYNVTATGIVGLMTRFWDKTARLMNLIGFDISTGEYTGMKENAVKDEKIDQTFIDASNYGVIARIYLEGKWGK